MTDRRFGLHLLKSLRRDENGAVLPLVAVMLTVMIGGAAMALDISRLYTMQSSQQKAADAYALAAAAELDGRTDATTRANAAIDSLMVNRNKAEGAFLNTVTRTYYSALPTNDGTAMGGTIAGSQADAKFVRVQVNSNLTTAFPLELVGMAGTTLGSGAEAVAGSTLIICDPIVMLMCRKTTNLAGGELDVTTAQPGDMMVAKASGGGNAFGAGNVGWIDYGSNSTPALIALVGPSTPFAACQAKPNGITSRPGDPTPASRAFNSRFDIFDTSMNSYKNDAPYAPAPNVRKLYTGGGGSTGANSCNSNLASGTPVNGVIKDATSPFTVRAVEIPDVASTGADFNDYWAALGTGVANPNLSNDPAGINARGIRYKYYKYEIDNGIVTSRSGTALTGVPGCHNSVGTADRRLFSVLVVDCEKTPINGNSTIAGSIGAAQFFMTKPMTPTGPDDYIYAEFQNFVSSSNANHVSITYLVQLYR